MPMTNAEILQRQQQAREAAERRKTLPARLNTLVAFAEGRALINEAIETLAWYEAELKRARQELNAEIREGQRAAGDAYADGRNDGMEEARGY